MKTMEMTTQAEELRAGRTIIVNTVGTSMQPLLYENDTQVVVTPLQQPLKKGDMVLYETKTGNPVIHRIIMVSEESVMIRGDNEFQSETVPYERIVGLATEVFRHRRHYTTDGWELQFYAMLVTGLFPFRYGIWALMHKCAAVLPQPVVRAARAIVKQLRN